ncbi:MAG: hypothetical protein ACOH5I_26660 [Oligoflexus sp.]
MKIAHIMAFSIILLSACADSSLYENQLVNESTNEFLGLVGGKDIQPGNFQSIGRGKAEKSLGCTITRIGPRHFITGGHCLKSGKGSSIIMESFRSKKTEKFRLAHAPLAPNSFEGLPAPNKFDKFWLSQYYDWGVFSIKSEPSIEDSIRLQQFLKSGFTTRKIADKFNLKKNSTILFAGGGFSKSEGGNILGSCEGKEKGKWVDCVDLYAPVTAEKDNSDEENNFNEEGDVLNKDNFKYAYFQIHELGNQKKSENELGFLFASKHPSIVQNNDFMLNEGHKIKNKPRNLDDNVLGIIALGDSGGPVLNSQLEIVGVGAGSFIDPFAKNGIEHWSIFSSINPNLIELELEKPIIDYSPIRANIDVPFVVVGYQLNNLTLKSDTGRVANSASCLEVSEAQILYSQGLVEGTNFRCYKSSYGEEFYNFFDGIYKFDERIYIDGGDEDSDGVADSIDHCPHTEWEFRANVDKIGCPLDVEWQCGQVLETITYDSYVERNMIYTARNEIVGVGGYVYAKPYSPSIRDAFKTLNVHKVDYESELAWAFRQVHGVYGSNSTVFFWCGDSECEEGKENLRQFTSTFIPPISYTPVITDTLTSFKWLEGTTQCMYTEGFYAYPPPM